MTTPVRGNVENGGVTWGVPARAPAAAGSAPSMENIYVHDVKAAVDDGAYVIFWVPTSQLTHVYYSVETGTCDVSLFRLPAGGGTGVFIASYTLLGGVTDDAAVGPVSLAIGERLMLSLDSADANTRELNFGCYLT